MGLRSEALQMERCTKLFAFVILTCLPYSVVRILTPPQSRRQRSISSFQYEVRSLAQALQDRTQQYWISAALYADQRPAGKLDMDRSRIVVGCSCALGARIRGLDIAADTVTGSILPHRAPIARLPRRPVAT